MEAALKRCGVRVARVNDRLSMLHVSPMQSEHVGCSGQCSGFYLSLKRRPIDIG